MSVCLCVCVSVFVCLCVCVSVFRETGSAVDRICLLFIYVLVTNFLLKNNLFICLEDPKLSVLHVLYASVTFLFVGNNII